MSFVDHCFMWKYFALKIKFLLVSYPHFLKISFKLTKCGLSYSLKCDLRPVSEFTQVWTILSWNLEAANDRLKIQLGTISLFKNIEFPVYQWQPPKSILEAVNDTNGHNLCTFWEWLRIMFEAIAEATIELFEWSFQKIWVWYQ